MTTTLTEQWRDGTLKDGWYYVTSKQFGMLIDRYRDQTNDCGDEWRGFDNCQGIADEILAPVPTYEEFVQQRDFVKEHQKVLIENMNLKLKIERLEKQIAKTKTKEYIVKVDWFSPDPVGFLSEKQTRKMFGDWKKEVK